VYYIHTRVRLAEEQRVAIDEIMRVAEELAKRQEALSYRLEYSRALHSEAKDLTLAQRITRAFVFSYIELVQWIAAENVKFRDIKVQKTSSTNTSN